MVLGAEPAPRQPWAELQQRETSADDAALIAKARRLHPTCAWWWGRVIQGTRAQAVCYVCGGIMTSFDTRYQLQPAPRATILRHRAQHVATLRPSILAKGDKA